MEDKCPTSHSLPVPSFFFFFSFAHSLCRLCVSVCDCSEARRENRVTAGSSAAARVSTLEAEGESQSACRKPIVRESESESV